MPRDTLASLRRERDELGVAKKNAEIKWQEKWDALWDNLGKKAVEEEWCEAFEEFAEANDGPKHKYQVTVVIEEYRPLDAEHVDEKVHEALTNYGVDYESMDVIKV